MLKHLHITNIILVESASIEFADGFNVLSGETGSGKSAIMNAISLIAGQRAETSCIRKGAEKGIVEAVFDSSIVSFVEKFLNEAGIDLELGEDVYIRREISSNGKSRAFINNQLAQLSVLRTICSHLINIVGQHANQDLLSLDRQRAILDLFGDLKKEALLFSKGWQEENELQHELSLLMNGEAQRLRDMEAAQMILEELEEAALKEGEDEELFQEYTLLSHAEELGSKVHGICSSLSHDKMAVLPLLNRHNSVLDSLARIDPSLGEIAQSFQNAVLELQEVAHSLNLYATRLEHNPNRLQEVNERLTLITRLKKKFGTTLEEIQAFANSNKQKLDDMQNADVKIEALQEKLKGIKEQNNKLALKLTENRKKAAQKLARALKSELSSLNMPQVDFQIDVKPQKRHRFGDDEIEFFLLPNVGENRISIKSCASGGELSRVMLSLQTLLSGKEQIPTLVFDEIDANIGGETAKVVGEKLKELGIKQQVLCITHFPQVARFADHHLQISKKVIENRTLTLIQVLNEDKRELEIARMAGV